MVSRFFYCFILLWFWYQDATGFIEWIWQYSFTSYCVNKLKSVGLGSYLSVWWNLAVNLSGPRLFFEGRLLITTQISFPVMGLFKFSCLRDMILVREKHLEVVLLLVDCPDFQNVSFTINSDDLSFTGVSCSDTFWVLILLIFIFCLFVLVILDKGLSILLTF